MQRSDKRQANDFINCPEFQVNLNNGIQRPGQTPAVFPTQEIKKEVAVRQDVPNLAEISHGGQLNQEGVNRSLWSSERGDP